MREAITLKAKKIENSKYTWFAPLCTACTTPFELPDVADITEQAEKFNNPPVTEVEAADDAAGESRAR